MESWEREFHVARIIAGKNRCRVDGQTMYVVAPTREQRFVACEVYRDTRRDATLEGALSEKDLLAILHHHLIWTPKEAEELDKLTQAVEDLKVGLFENRLRSNAKLSIRTALRKTKSELTRLESLRHGLDYLTVDGLAMSAKYRYLVGASLRYPDGNPYFADDSWDQEDPLVDKVIESFAADRLEETHFREIARTEPWRGVWSARSHVGRGLFDVSAVDMTDDQKTLLIWSSVFDNIREYPDAPGDDVLEEDDMLDGWMIIQRRKREKQAASSIADSLGQTANPKMKDRLRNAEEIFVVADTVEDARQVEKLNDAANAMNKSKRMAFLKQKGEVNEVYMPDTAAKIQMEFNRLEAMSMRQMRGK